jgi:hypothetical protein
MYLDSLYRLQPENDAADHLAAGDQERDILHGHAADVFCASGRVDDWLVFRHDYGVESRSDASCS